MISIQCALVSFSQLLTVTDHFTVRYETCSFQNETLCNAHIGNYPTSLELKSQPAKKLQCYICQTTDSDSCLEPAEKFISDCPDISYDCCYLRKRGSY